LKLIATFNNSTQGAVNVGIGLACPPCGVAFAAIWGFFNFLGNQFGEDFERRICQDIIEKGHTALSKKVPLADGTQMCVWDRLRNSGNFEHYIQGVNDIGGETLDVVQISQEENARVPDPLAKSEVKSLMNFLVNVVPKPGIGSALHLTGKALVVSKIGDMMTEQLFRDATAQLFSDVRVYRTTTVLYLLQLFYAEAVIRKEDGEEITVAEDYDDTNWLNMDVFGHYLRDKLVSKLNSERGKPGLLNVDICLGGVRPGKISGCNDEYEKLLTAFNDAQAGFIEYYLSGLSGRGTGSGGGFRGSGGDGGRGGAGKSPF